MIAKAMRSLLVGFCFLTGASGLLADDIDIFSQSTDIPQSAPNVLIVMDNRASTNSSFGASNKFDSVKEAMAIVVGALQTQFRLGIMMFTESGSPNSNVKGGYVRFAVQDMTTVDVNGDPTATDARNCLLYMVGAGGSCATTDTDPATPVPYYTVLTVGNNGGTGGDDGDAAMSSIAMSEAYKYFTGANAYSGHEKVKADPRAFTSLSVQGPVYKKPITDACQKNFIIFISNGNINDSASTSATAMDFLRAAGETRGVIIPPDTANNNIATDEWTRFLYDVTTVKAKTYALEVGPELNGQGPYTTSLLQSMGRQGKGGYYAAIDSASLINALTRIFNDINAQNSVFASSSLPLSADNSGTFLNQVYIGMFRPDAQGRPRWLGNLKQYQFALDGNSNLFLADRLGIGAASASTGFAQPDGLSFWTGIDDNFTYTTTPPATPYTSTPDSATTYTANPGTGGFWFFDNKGSGGSYDGPDGEWVEKGGAAQRLRLAYLGYGNDKAGNPRAAIGSSSEAGRKMLTCMDNCLNTVNPIASPTAVSVPLVTTAGSSTTFDESNTEITDSLLGTRAVTISSLSIADSKSVGALSAGIPMTITSISKSGGAGTATTSPAHGFVTGDTIVIAGAGNQFNGTYFVTVLDTTTFTFVASNGNSSGTAGTATKAVTTARATTSAAHAWSIGERVTIAGATPSVFNGVFTLTEASGSTFAYELPSKQGVAATGTITATSNKVTGTATNHGFVAGDAVTISGASPAGYNGVQLISIVDANTFTYLYPTAASAGSATGTIQGSVGGGRTTLIRWIRGVDTQDENGDTQAVDVRASVHGDVLHSRPVVLNYGAAANSDNVYLFYGGNDGVFRAIKGGQGATDGVEQWAFIPKEFIGRFKRMYNNSPSVLYATTPDGITPEPLRRDYFWDGPVASYVERGTNPSDTATYNQVTKAILYLSVRRGGRFIYALDVTNVATPKLLWRKGCTSMTDNTTCDTGLEEFGQTWSQPNVAKIKGKTNPVLIFGGGYDAVAEDVEPPGANTKGRALYVLDALTGQLVWSAGNAGNSTPSRTVSGMDFSIAADVLPLDRNQDGNIDRVYAADVGGNIWRFDIGDVTDTGSWGAAKLAQLGDRTASEAVPITDPDTGVTNNVTYKASRKFLFGMDVVFGDTFDAVLIGSGDREHPLVTQEANKVVNRFYMIKDTNTGLSGSALGISDTCVSTVTTDPDTGWCTNLFDATIVGSVVPDTAKGWFVTLLPGEQVVNSPLVVAGSVLFGTNQPKSLSGDEINQCVSNLGTARRYSIGYLGAEPTRYSDQYGEARFEEAIGGGFLPSAVAGIVDVGGTKMPFVTDNPLNPGGAFSPTINPAKKRYRIYWRQKLE